MPAIALVFVAVVAVIGVAVIWTLGGREPDNTNTSPYVSTLTSNTNQNVITDTPEDQVASVAVDTSVSTPIGNLVNGGYVCEDEDNVYYTTPVTGADGWYTDSIVRMSKSGAGTQVIYTNDASGAVLYHLNAESGRVIFSEEAGGSARVKSVGIDGSDPVTLSVADEGSLVQVYEGYVYYVSGGTLKVMNPDGSNQRDVLSVGSQLWRISNDRIVYFDGSGATSAYMADLDGSDARTFVQAPYSAEGDVILNVIPTPEGTYDVLRGPAGGSTYYEIDNYDANGSNGTFVMEGSDGVSVTRINPTSLGRIIVFSYPPYFPDDDVWETQLAFIDQSLDDAFYTTRDSSVILRSPTLVNGYVYFGYEQTGSNRLMRVPYSGGSVETVA